MWCTTWLVGTVFVHIPRTGGSSIRREAQTSLNVWHSALTSPPDADHCDITTSLRNETARYCSEWGHYGLKFFAKDTTVKGWIPHNGFPHTFEEFLRDNSTHNSQTKILSGCQLYDSNCHVDVHSVARIVARIKSGCIRVTRARIVRHTNDFRCSSYQQEAAHRANHLDYLLLSLVNRD